MSLLNRDSGANKSKNIYKTH